MYFTENLKRFLSEKKMKQADLCRMTGIQSSLMSDYLSGKKSPAIGNAIAIADALHVSLDALVSKEVASPLRQNAPVLDELYQSILDLSTEEQLYLLDTVRALKLRLGRGQK